MVFFVGGIFFYLKVLLCGLFDGLLVDWEIWREIEWEVEVFGIDILWCCLEFVDFFMVYKLYLNDKCCMICVLEVFC